MNAMKDYDSSLEKLIWQNFASANNAKGTYVLWVEGNLKKNKLTLTSLNSNLQQSNPVWKKNREYQLFKKTDTMDGYHYTPNQGVKAPFDPGWNDPPKLSYNNQQTPNKPRNILNKRVAFPLSSNANSSIAAPAATQPPMPPIPSVLPPIASKTQTLPSSEEVQLISDKCTLEEVKSILIDFLDNSSELGPKAADIKKRISMMETMWTSGKLNSQVQTLMKKLAYALRDDKPCIADDIHRALMVDHVNAVGSWMPGVKQLVHHSIARSELLAIDKEM